MWVGNTTYTLGLQYILPNFLNFLTGSVGEIWPSHQFLPNIRLALFSLQEKMVRMYSSTVYRFSYLQYFSSFKLATTVKLYDSTGYIA